MTYSKIINIESRLSNLCYKFKIDKRFKFRFLTIDNDKGIEFNSATKVNNINNTDTLTNNWYIFDNDIDLSPLNNFRYLILQLYSETIINDSDIILHESNQYYITKNNWYNCSTYGPTCGIEIFNYLIDENKPMQELDSLFRYTIDGDASIVKKKYLKAGSEKSEIIVRGNKPYVVNYISIFYLNKIEGSQPKNKSQPRSINKILDLVDNKLYPNFVSDNPEINSINARIEMIKFQLKNYFIENNQELDIINKNINIDKDNIKLQGVKINDLEDKVDENEKDINNKFDSNISNIKGELKLVSSLLNSQISAINENFVNVNESLQDLHTTSDNNFDSIKVVEDNVKAVKNEVDKVSLEAITNLNSINKINCDIEDLNKKNNELENEDIKLRNLNSQLLSKIDSIITKTDTLQEIQECLKLDISKISTDFYDYKNNSDNLLWGNINGVPYRVDQHDEVINLQYFIDKKTYIKQKFYLLCDYNNLILPYYVLQVKEVNDSIAVARLVQMTKY